MHEYPYPHHCLALAATSFVISLEQGGGISIPTTFKPIYYKSNRYQSLNVNQVINGWGKAEIRKQVLDAFNYKIQKQRKPFLQLLKRIELGEKSRLLVNFEEDLIYVENRFRH